MPVGKLADVFSSYPHQVAFGPEGGNTRHETDGFRVDVPAGAIAPGHSVELRIDWRPLEGALPPAPPGVVFEKVSRSVGATADTHVYVLEIQPEYVFKVPLQIRFQTWSAGMGRYTVLTNDGADPAGWRARDEAPWIEKLDVLFQAAILYSRQPGKPRTRGGPRSRYFVVGHLG